ncbi:hypothetical protein N2152v2_007670 [Parachlorella kessleri]
MTSQMRWEMKALYSLLLCLAMLLACGAWSAASSTAAVAARVAAQPVRSVASATAPGVAASAPVPHAQEGSAGEDRFRGSSTGAASSSPSAGDGCHAMVQRYLERRSGALSLEQDPSRMLFFLHVPRTAGKTYYTCFLKAALPPSKRCVRSYDKLRLNLSAPSCTLLSSHDDLSISDDFPMGAAVITQLRKPLARVLSSYEFAIDVAARHVHLPDDDKIFTEPNTSVVSTYSVWPWSYLVPWFRRDMRARMAKLNREAQYDTSGRPRWLSFKDSQNRTYYWSSETNKSVWTLPTPKQALNPYNNPLVTPLHEWIELPVAHELVHNTATLQILGLTNYSHWEEAAQGRDCVRRDPAAREALLGVAVRRLVGMRHVGLSEKLDQSVLSLAASLGLRMSGPAYKQTPPAHAFSYDEPDLDESQLITYNSSIHYANVTVSLSVARQRLVWINARHINLTDELQVLVPRLTDLLEKEEDWLEEQEDAPVAGRGTAGGGGRISYYDLAALEDRGAVGGAGEGPLQRILLENEGSSSDGDGAGPEQPHRRRRVVQSELKEKKQKKKRQRGVAPQHPDAAVAAAAGAAAATGGEQQQGSHQVDSPWARDIEALDAQVAGMQLELKRLDWDIWSIQHSGGVRYGDQARGRAKQILPDEHFLQKGTLGRSYMHCTSKTGQRHTASRSKVFRHVVTPWHESFAFTKEARRRVPQTILDRILELNRLDQQLWELGDKLLSAKVAEQQAAGVLEQLERPKPSPHTRPRRRSQLVEGDTSSSSSSSREEGGVEYGGSQGEGEQGGAEQEEGVGRRDGHSEEGRHEGGGEGEADGSSGGYVANLAWGVEEADAVVGLWKDEL